MRALSLICVAGCGLMLGPADRAQLNSEQRKTGEKMVEGKFYIRLDAPCIYGAKTAAGLWFDPLLKVSPTGHKLLPVPPLSKKQYVYWGSGPNDPVGYGSLKMAGETVYVWLEGRSPAANEFVIEFNDIKTLDDFKAAWARAFSAIPLQDEHPEWPAEIRNAIRDHRVVEGMTKEQAFMVVGEPQSVETSAEKGVAVEIWHPRQVNGRKQPYHHMKDRDTGYPATLKFADGKLVAIDRVSPR